MLEAAAEFDDALMSAYLEGAPICAGRDPQGAPRAARSSSRSCRCVCGAAFKNKGVQPLLDAIVDYLPSPLDVPPVQGIEPKSGEERCAARATTSRSPRSSSSSTTDKHVGHLTYVRVYSGHAKTGDAGAERREGRAGAAIGRLLQMHANKRQELDEVYAGDIAAVVGLRDVVTGDTLAAVNAADPARVARLPGARDLDRDRAEDQGRHGPPRPDARPPGPGGPVVPGDDRPGDRPDADLRHGRAPPRDHHRPAAARVRRAGQRRPPAGRVQGDDHRAGARRGPLHQADRRLGRLRRRRARGRAGRAGLGLPFEKAFKGGAIPPEFVPAVRQGCEEASQSGELGGYPVVDIQRAARRRAGPRRRLVRALVQDRGLDGDARGAPQGEARAARAAHGRRGR